MIPLCRHQLRDRPGGRGSSAIVGHWFCLRGGDALPIQSSAGVTPNSNSQASLRRYPCRVERASRRSARSGGPHAIRPRRGRSDCRASDELLRRGQRLWPTDPHAASDCCRKTCWLARPSTTASRRRPNQRRGPRGGCRCDAPSRTRSVRESIAAVAGRDPNRFFSRSLKRSEAADGFELRQVRAEALMPSVERCGTLWPPDPFLGEVLAGGRLVPDEPLNAAVVVADLDGVWHVADYIEQQLLASRDGGD